LGDFNIFAILLTIESCKTQVKWQWNMNENEDNDFGDLYVLEESDFPGAS